MRGCDDTAQLLVTILQKVKNFNSSQVCLPSTVNTLNVPLFPAWFCNNGHRIFFQIDPFLFLSAVGSYPPQHAVRARKTLPFPMELSSFLHHLSRMGKRKCVRDGETKNIYGGKYMPCNARPRPLRRSHPQAGHSEKLKE